MNAPAPSRSRGAWRYVRVLAVPALVWLLLAAALRDPLRTWVGGEESYDVGALQEWLEETRGFQYTLPEMVSAYLDALKSAADAAAADPPDQRLIDDAADVVSVRREEIEEHLKALGNPATKMYAGQLPLFPVIYRLEVRFDDDAPATVIWDSGIPSPPRQSRELLHRVHPRAAVYLRYQLHAYNKRQRIEQEHAERARQLGLLALVATALGLLWMALLQRRERRLARERQLAEERHAAVQRELLEQRLATQAAEGHALQLRSQMYASISIMAGSYAHNIKNLLVRPNDLLARCLEGPGLSTDLQTMIQEVRQTLGTVTERLQEILRTVRRDPSQSELTVLDLNDVVRELQRTWSDLAADRWKLDLVLEVGAEPVLIRGDASQLQQAVENLLFNARDATFEMRNHRREEARNAACLAAAERRQALIDAASWRGRVVVTVKREGDRAVLVVADDGAGMTDEVRRHCTDTHFSTKRDNALYEGHSTGMGLGLSFVVAIVNRHEATLSIDSAVHRGTTFTIQFPTV